MQASANFAQGKTSRSLKAAFIALDAGAAPQVVHLSQGVYGWYKAGGEMTAEYDMSNVGRSPNAASTPPAGAPVEKETANK